MTTVAIANDDRARAHALGALDHTRAAITFGGCIGMDVPADHPAAPAVARAMEALEVARVALMDANAQIRTAPAAGGFIAVIGDGLIAGVGATAVDAESSALTDCADLTSSDITVYPASAALVERVERVGYSTFTLDRAGVARLLREGSNND